MIQRIQTLYMALAFIASAVLSFVLPIAYVEENQIFAFNAHSKIPMLVFAISSALTMVSILSYKKRKNQFVLNRLNMILNFILVGLFVSSTLNLSGGENNAPEKGIGMLLPLVSIFLLVFANRAIKKDEELVKSADRIR